MELLFFLFLLVVLILAFVSLSKLNGMGRRFDELQVDLRELRSQLRSLKTSQPEATQTPPTEKLWSWQREHQPTPEAERVREPTVPQPADKEEPPVPSGVTPPPLPSQRPLPEFPAERKPAIAAAAETAKAEPSRFESSVREILAKIWNWIVVGEEHRPKGVTMEFAVATTWLLRIGVLILVIGIGFFLKYSIAKGLIGPTGRVLLATLAGAGLVGGGLRLFGGRYAVLGQGLAGAGFATLYFSFFTAHQPDYALLGAVPAFALMVLVTAVAGVVAVRFNSLLVAVLGLLGGYGTPLMIRSGNESIALLFGYLLLLGLGMFLIASRRNWRLLHYLSFAATCTHVGWVLERSFVPERFWEFMPFLLAFFVLFSSVTFVYQLLHRRPSTLLELIFLFFNAAAFTGFSVHCIEATYRREAIALLTLGLAVFYILHIGVFLKRRIQDRGLLLSFMGLASFFVAITLPLVLSKGWITVSWALQAFVMLWISSKMRSEFLRQLAYLLYLVVLARFALFDLREQFDGLSPDLTPGDYAKHFVERLFVFGIPIGSFFAAGRLFRHEGQADPLWSVGEENDIRPLPGQSGMGRICFWIVVALTFVYLNLEVSKTMERLFDPFVRPALTLVWIALGALLLRERLVNRSSLATALLWVLAAALVVKVFLLDFLFWKPGFDLAFARREFVPGLLMRAIDYGAVALFFLLASRVLSRKSDTTGMVPVFGYAALAGAFLYSSLEIWTGLSHFLPVFRMGGISIYWSLFAIAMLLAGILKNRAALRGIGLFLLASTILKVFFVDLAGLDQLYRIVAFIVLGVVVLAGSFLYFKYSHRFATVSESGDADAGNDDEPSPTEP